MSAFIRNFFAPLFFVINKIIRNYKKSKIFFEQSNIMLNETASR
jgi:hypothetical protein